MGKHATYASDFVLSNPPGASPLLICLFSTFPPLSICFLADLKGSFFFIFVFLFIPISSGEAISRLSSRRLSPYFHLAMICEFFLLPSPESQKI